MSNGRQLNHGSKLSPSGTIHNKLNATLASRLHTASGSEKPLLHHGASDLFDYKTDRPDGEDVESFVSDLVAYPEPQMLAYAAALRAADPSRDVSVRLVFTAADCEVGELGDVRDPQRALFDRLGKSP